MVVGGRRLRKCIRTSAFRLLGVSLGRPRTRILTPTLANPPFQTRRQPISASIPRFLFTMASCSSPPAAQKRRRMPAQTKEGMSSQLLPCRTTILTFAVQAISKATRRSDRIRAATEKSSKSRTDTKLQARYSKQEACWH